MATAAEELMQKGIRRGIEQGIRQGVEQGIRQGEVKGQGRLLIRQLTLRFGQCPDEIVQRVHAASITELDIWGERVLTADRLDAVFEV